MASRSQRTTCLMIFQIAVEITDNYDQRYKVSLVWSLLYNRGLRDSGREQYPFEGYGKNSLLQPLMVMRAVLSVLQRKPDTYLPNIL